MLQTETKCQLNTLERMSFYTTLQSTAFPEFFPLLPVATSTNKSHSFPFTKEIHAALILLLPFEGQPV